MMEIIKVEEYRRFLDPPFVSEPKLQGSQNYKFSESTDEKHMPFQFVIRRNRLMLLGEVLIQDIHKIWDISRKRY